MTELFKDVSIDSFDFKNHIICFDDLERCQIQTKEILGFINRFVEHKSLKTVILADENKIEGKDKNYDSIKEKVIGRTLHFKQDVKSILPELFKKYKKEDNLYFNFLNQHREYISSIFKVYDIQNLRTISFLLDNISKLFPDIKQLNSDNIEEIIFFSCIISIEYKSGRLTSSDYNKDKGINNFNYLMLSLSLKNDTSSSLEKNEEKKPSYPEFFYKQYVEKDINKYFFFPSIYVFILTGYLDANHLKQEIESRNPKNIPSHIKDFRKLLNYKFRELSNTEFHTLSNNVLKYTKQGVYSIYDYIQIGSFYYFFSDNKLINKSIKEIEEIILEGIEIAKKRKRIEDDVLRNLMHFTNNDTRIENLKSVIKSIHDEILEDRNKKISTEFLDTLLNKDEFELADIFNKYKFKKELFLYINDKSFIETILKVSNKQLFNFTELLNDRYKPTNIKEFLSEERNTLLKLYENLKSFLNANENKMQQPRKFLFITLEMKLLIICDRLDSSKD